MKRLFTFSVLLIVALSLSAQAPQYFSYQAVVRKADNSLLTSSPVGMKISIIKGSATGTTVYSETHTTTTNANGLLSVNIGAGTPANGTFSNINWGNDKYFIKTEIDPDGGTKYSITSTTQLISVPYALYAKTAESSNAPWNLTGNNIFFNSGNVGIGQSTPISKLHVEAPSSEGRAIYARSNSDAAGTHAIFGGNYSPSSGTSNSLNGSMAGVFGYTNWSRKHHYGVLGARVDRDYGPSGGVMGLVNVTDTTKAWGALGYQDEALKEYGGYFKGNVKTNDTLFTNTIVAKKVITDNLQIKSRKISEYKISFLAFFPLSSSIPYITTQGDVRMLDGVQGTLYAPVNLSENFIIHFVRFVFYDNDVTNDLTCKLITRSSTQEKVLAEIVTTGAKNYDQSLGAVVDDYEVYNNADEFYLTVTGNFADKKTGIVNVWIQGYEELP